ncbi:MAG TPA: biotin synthase BioB [Smithellaceae bacterium]|nr:biotin synthase BioB [Smithellaceae bacterium]
MDIINKYQNKAIEQDGLTTAEALGLFLEGTCRPFRVMAAASEIREHFKSREIILCGIVNAKSGKCSEDCAFCAQSGHYKTDITTYPLKTATQIVEEAEEACHGGAEMFGIVTSGKGINSKKEWNEIFKAVEGINGLGMKACASLGMIDTEKARALKAAGLFRYHHNLETARGYFDNICSTHSYLEDIETIQAAKAAGLTVCAGGIIGMGEGIIHRIEMAETIRELGVECVPLNILNPIKGTPLERAVPLPPLEILLTIAVFRFILPDRDIKLCGGKEKSLRQLLPLGIVAGANSLMIGNYLTTTGRDSTLDQEMVADLGLRTTRESRPLFLSGQCEKGHLCRSGDKKEDLIDNNCYYPSKKD